MSDSNVLITNDGTEMSVSLADIAGMDMAQVEEFEGGFDPTPKGVYHFRCKDAELTQIDFKDKKTGEDVTRAIIQFDMEIVNVLAFVDDGINVNDWIEKVHQETVFITDVAKGVGQAKAIMTNAGFTGNASLQELLDAFVGTEFDAPIAHRKNKDDPDVIHANIKIGKIIPHAQAQEATSSGSGGMNLGNPQQSAVV